MNEQDFAIKCMSLDQLVDASAHKTTISFRLSNGFTLAAKANWFTVHVVEFQGREVVAVTYRETGQLVNRQCRTLLAADVEWITVENSHEQPPKPADFPPIPQHASFELSVPGSNGKGFVEQNTGENQTERLQRQANEKPKVNLQVRNEIAPELNILIDKLANTRSELDIQLGQIFNESLNVFSKNSVKSITGCSPKILAGMVEDAAEHMHALLADNRIRHDERVMSLNDSSRTLLHTALTIRAYYCFAMKDINARQKEEDRVSGLGEEEILPGDDEPFER